MLLSKAIRQGALLRPQAFYTFLDRSTSGSCALGAALEAVGLDISLPPDECISGLKSLKIHKQWKASFVAPPYVCPDCNWASKEISSVIIHLNNEERWTRERIASWVARHEKRNAKVQV